MVQSTQQMMKRFCRHVLTILQTPRHHTLSLSVLVISRDAGIITQIVGLQNAEDTINIETLG